VIFLCRVLRESPISVGVHTLAVFSEMAEESCYSMQLIDGDGVLNATDFEKFTRDVNLAECGLSYVVVSVMGPQSSGTDHF
jgi:hypothetical protein